MRKVLLSEGEREQITAFDASELLLNHGHVLVIGQDEDTEFVIGVVHETDDAMVHQLTHLFIGDRIRFQLTALAEV